MIFVIGGRGLIGSAIVRYLERNKVEYRNIQRENKTDFFGKSCDILIYANGNALKYKANEDPYFDFEASVMSASEYIHKIKHKKFILISTVSTYSDTASTGTTREDVKVDYNKLDNYGFHKRIVENLVGRYCEKFLIFRLSGLVGIGLKKNQIFDYCHDNKKVMVSKNSSMNFTNTDFIADTIFRIIDKKIDNEIFNIASSNNIKIKDLEKIVGFKSEYANDAEKKNVVNYTNVEKISKYVKMSRSEDAILKYYNSIK